MTLDLRSRPAGPVHSDRTALRCTVVVVNYGSHGLLAVNLVPLSVQDPDLDVVVVDNFTSPDEAAEVSELGRRHGWTVLRETTNVGFGAGANRGAAWAIEHGAEQILLLNPDATIDRHDLSLLRERVGKDPMVMVSPTVVTPEGRPWFDGAVVDLVRGSIHSHRVEAGDRSTEVTWLSGACLLVSAELWRAVGGFDERYFLYWEDVDLSYRVQLAGGRLEVVKDATAIHRQGGTQETRSSEAKSDTYYYHMVRNRLLFAGEHLEWRDRFRWLLRSPKYARDVVLHGGRRQLLHSASPLLQVARGTSRGALLSSRAARSRRRVEKCSSQIVVLQSVPTPKPTTNPYNVLLADALDDREDITIRMFGWKEALLHRHDVFHAHWPEALITRRGLVKTRARQALFAALLLKWKLNGTTVVRTVHNLDLPSGIDAVERYLLDTLEKMTVGRVTLNPFTPVDGYQGPVQVVVHGHYLPWFEQYDEPEPEPGRLAFFGGIRRYKGVEGLVKAFHSSTRDDLTLSIAGRPSTSALADSLLAVAEEDPRITFDLEFVETAALVHHIGKAELVVLPHTDMHNSGSAIAALSLNRPVLVQDNEVNRWLQEEAGKGWVHLYQGDLTPVALSRAIEALRNQPPVAAPDLSSRDWTTGASLHAKLYRESVAVHQGRGVRETRAGGGPTATSHARGAGGA